MASVQSTPRMSECEKLAPVRSRPLKERPWRFLPEKSCGITKDGSLEPILLQVWHRKFGNGYGGFQLGVLAGFRRGTTCHTPYKHSLSPNASIPSLLVKLLPLK